MDSGFSMAGMAYCLPVGGGGDVLALSRCGLELRGRCCVEGSVLLSVGFTALLLGLIGVVGQLYGTQ